MVRMTYISMANRLDARLEKPIGSPMVKVYAHSSLLTTRLTKSMATKLAALTAKLISP
jgi:hypothetical protein